MSYLEPMTLPLKQVKFRNWALVVVLGLLLASSSNINWGAEHWRTVLQVDARGYYAYLPALLLEADPNFGSFEKNELELTKDPKMVYDYRHLHNERYINKYYIGTAIMELPFFTIAHIYAVLNGTGTEGWSKPYIVSVNLSAIALVMLGLWAMARILESYGVSDLNVAFTLVSFAFGTNLFYYTVVAPGMSHAYSFGLCTAYLLHLRHLALQPSPRSWIASCVLLGAIILVRPVNGVILLAMPIFLNDHLRIQGLTKMLKNAPMKAVIGVLAFSIVVSIQLIYYKVATGDWVVYSYGEEGFNWAQPHWWDILWSYRKGLFVYTPLTLLAFVGSPFLYRVSRRSLIAWSAFFVILTYLLSSWWNWWYGGSFGARVYVEFLSLFALPFGLALENLKGTLKRTFLVTAALLVVFCQIQTYQARYYRIHWSDMDKERYWDEFLRIDRLP